MTRRMVIVASYSGDFPGTGGDRPSRPVHALMTAAADFDANDPSIPEFDGLLVQRHRRQFQMVPIGDVLHPEREGLGTLDTMKRGVGSLFVLGAIPVAACSG